MAGLICRVGEVMQTGPSLSFDEYCSVLSWEGLGESERFLGLDLDGCPVRFQPRNRHTEPSYCMLFEAAPDHYSTLVEFIASQSAARDEQVIGYSSSNAPLLPNCPESEHYTDMDQFENGLGAAVSSITDNRTPDSRALVVMRPFPDSPSDDLMTYARHPRFIWLVIDQTDQHPEPSLIFSPRTINPCQYYRFRKPDHSAFVLRPETSGGLIIGPEPD